MSLRKDFHSAFDEVAPSTYGLPERVVSLVVAERQLRVRGPRWSLKLRGIASLAAVLVLLAMVVTVLAGDRIQQDWNAFNARTAAGIDQTELHQLESRPLTLPVLPPGAACPAGPYGPHAGFGTDPLYGTGGAPNQTSWGTYFYASALTNPNMSGLVLGRARDLNTGRTVVFIGDRATGPVVGNDIDQKGVKIQQHSEVLLDGNHPPRMTTDSGKYVVWRYAFGDANVADWGQVCIGFQFDGPGFTDAFVIPGSALIFGPFTS